MLSHRVGVVAAVTAVGSLLFGSAAVQAVPIASDGFEDYAAGDQLHGQGGGTGWVGAWDVPNGARQPESTIISPGLGYFGGEIRVDGGSRSFEYAASEAGIAVLATRQLPAIPNDVVYMSFAYQVSANDDSNLLNGNDFIQLGFESSAGNPRVSALDRAGEIQVRSTTDAANSVGSGFPSSVGETLFAVLRAEKTGGSSTYNDIRLFTNPVYLDESMNTFVQSTVDSGLDLTSSAFASIRKAFHENGDTMVYDEIRIGTSFDDVVTPSGRVLGPPQVLFEDPFDVDPAGNGWTEMLSNTGDPGDIFANGDGQVLLGSDGLNVDGNDDDTRSITRTIDATGFFDVTFTLDALDDGDNGLEGADELRILIDAGAGFFPVQIESGDFGGGGSSGPLTLGPTRIPLGDDRMFQFRIEGETNVEDYILDHLVVTGRIANVVPEPATAALLGVGALALLRRRRRIAERA